MRDRYQSLIRSPLGQLLAKNLGLPNPVSLERYRPGDPLVSGSVVVGSPGDDTGRLATQVLAALDLLGIPVADEAAKPAPDHRYKGLVFDATALTSTDRLAELQAFFTPLMRSLDPCARIVVLGTPPESVSGGERVAQRALEGFTLSLGKEIGHGGTVQLVYVEPGAEGALASTLGFLLSAKSAYVSGQVIRIGVHGADSPVEEVEDWSAPLAGKVALVTGASRGIGEQIARVLHRDGARVLGVDVPQAASDLQVVMRELDGDHLTVDITTKDAPQRIARHVKESYSGVDIVVHNAGITRDKKLANMKPDGFASVIAVNVTAPERITTELLEQKLLNDNGRIVGVASIAGIAGNLGQTNYGASKAAVIGLVDSLADELDRGITINAVAPGFIETAMTAAMPLATREVGRRLNSMSQGGLPVDVAETVAWFANPASTAVSGNVVRVCGQMMLGA
ncbi:MAG: 3-oxoacyl-ACP reductase [Nocardioidaceae bacterium]